MQLVEKVLRIGAKVANKLNSNYLSSAVYVSIYKCIKHQTSENWRPRPTATTINVGGQGPQALKWVPGGVRTITAGSEGGHYRTIASCFLSAKVFMCLMACWPHHPTHHILRLFVHKPRTPTLDGAWPCRFGWGRIMGARMPELLGEVVLAPLRNGSNAIFT